MSDVSQATVLPQRYAGIRFRSTLEARWAIFFDHAGLKDRWQYEPEGFVVAGRSYRPDFLLDCGTWVEVKGDPDRLDLDLMLAAARELPGRDGLAPKLLILGSIPETSPVTGDLGWLGLEHQPGWHAPRVGYFGFDAYGGNSRLTDRGMIWPEAYERLFLREDARYLFENLRNYGDAYFFLTPQFFPGEYALPAYAIARARRFGRR